MRRLLLGIAVAVAALMPAVSMADDQQIADYIKSRLQAEQQRGNLRGFNVDMRVDRGTVWFKGFVANPQQEMLILRTAQQGGHLGVVQVVDDIEIRATNTNVAITQAPQQPITIQQPIQMPPAIQPVQTQPIAILQQPLAMPQQPITGQVAIQQNGIQMPMPNTIPQQPLAAGPATAANAPMAFASTSRQEVQAQPMSAAMTGGNMGMTAESPNLPGYAWPGYAPHPNHAALTYTTQYSPQAWPYIGPFYPYPQVPLGWRKVELEWDDGWWYLDFHDK